MVQNLKTQGWVVLDIGERVQNVEEGYSVSSTTGANPGPVTRSVFQVIKEDNPRDLFVNDEFVRFGQKVRIVANPHLFRKPLQLNSQKHTPTICAPLSQKQIVYANGANPSADGLWVIDYVDPVNRFEMEGQVVKVGEPVLIRHVNTNVFLAADQRFKIKNDFGSENEVHCHNHSTHNKSQNLALEHQGRLTVDVPTKFQQNENMFVIVTAPDASFARPIEELIKFDINEAMKDLKARLYEKSAFGVKELTAIFQAMDKKGNHNLDVDDFRWGLMDYGIQISKEDAQELQ
jgi:hypothetical protein